MRVHLERVHLDCVNEMDRGNRRWKLMVEPEHPISPCMLLLPFPSSVKSSFTSREMQVLLLIMRSSTRNGYP